MVVCNPSCAPPTSQPIMCSFQFPAHQVLLPLPHPSSAPSTSQPIKCSSHFPIHHHVLFPLPNPSCTPPTLQSIKCSSHFPIHYVLLPLVGVILPGAIIIPCSGLGSYLGERVQIGPQDQHGDHHHQRHTQACHLVRERAGSEWLWTSHDSTVSQGVKTSWVRMHACGIWNSLALLRFHACPGPLRQGSPGIFLQPRPQPG